MRINSGPVIWGRKSGAVKQRCLPASSKHIFGSPRSTPATVIRTRAQLDQAILPIRLYLIRMLTRWTKEQVLSRSGNQGKDFTLSIPPLRVGSNQPFSIIYPEPQMVTHTDPKEGAKPLRIRALVWVGGLSGRLIDEKNQPQPQQFSVMSGVRVPFAQMDLHVNRDALPRFASKATLLRQCGVIRQAYGLSDIDIYVEGQYTEQNKPKGIVFRIEQGLQIKKPTEKKQEGVQVPPLDEIPPLMMGRAFMTAIEKNLRESGLVPPGTELVVQTGRGEKDFDEIKAIGLELMTRELSETSYFVPDSEIDWALKIRQHLIAPINTLRPGVYVPRLFAGALETLAFDFVQIGPHRFQFVVHGLRCHPGETSIQYEKAIPKNGSGHAHFSDGESVDAEGAIVNNTPIPNSALFKLARLMREDTVLPLHLSPNEMGIVFTEFKRTENAGKVIQEFLLEFVARGDRKQKYSEVGVPTEALSATDAQTIIAYLYRYVPRNIRITPKLDSNQHLQALDVLFPQ